MITISAFTNVPAFAKGLVRDLRVRGALEEAGLPYKARLLNQGDQNKPDYRLLQPFGQVPIFEEDGLVLFESGAISCISRSVPERCCPPSRQRGRARCNGFWRRSTPSSLPSGLSSSSTSSTPTRTGRSCGGPARLRL